MKTVIAIAGFIFLACCVHVGTMYWSERKPLKLTVKRDLVGSSRRPLSLAFRSDGRILVSGGRDGTVTLWNVETGRERSRFEGAIMVANSIALGRNGMRLVFPGKLESLDFVDLADCRRIPTRIDDQIHIRSVSFSVDGRILAVAGQDTIIRLYDADSGKAVAALKGHLDRVLAVSFSPDEDILVSAGEDSTVRIWDTARQVEIDVLIGHGSAIEYIAHSSDARRLATASHDGVICIWDMQKGRRLSLQLCCDGDITGMTFRPNSTMLTYSCIKNGESHIHICDCLSGRSLCTYDSDVCSLATPIAFSPDGQLLAIGMPGTIRLLELPQHFRKY